MSKELEKKKSELEKEFSALVEKRKTLSQELNTINQRLEQIRGSYTTVQELLGKDPKTEAPLQESEKPKK